ncbi:MOSC domain-containing protein [bacterium]|nr:MOSC domain-containing protein [bacterium]
MKKVVNICVSNKKGQKKVPVENAILKKDFGIVDDAHATPTSHRQVSLLSRESISLFKSRGVNVQPGDFAENIITEGVNLSSLHIGDKIHIGEEALLEVTQIGKECHKPCAIYHAVGDCIMPKEGIFAKVTRGGAIKNGDNVKIDYA